MDQQPDPTERPEPDIEPTLPPLDHAVDLTQERTVSDIDPTLSEDVQDTLVPSRAGDSRSSAAGASGSMGSGYATQDPSPSEGLRPGLELRDYRLLERVGEGAQGQVWKAYNHLAQKEMALKFMTSKLADRVRSMGAMQGEASVLFDLTHESIVRLNIPEQIDGYTFLVMEYLGGPSLSSLLQLRRRDSGSGLSAEECTWLLEQLAPALDYAAEKKVTHRDIKPGNIMLSRPVEAQASLVDYGGQVKLCDFGIAIVAQQDDQASGTYSAAGTPPYMAPEVIRGDKPEPAADIYSLGATLFALVQGKPPYRGSMPSILQKQQSGPPPPLESGNRALDQAVARALAFDPAERFESADDFLYEASGRRLGRRAERKTRQVWALSLAGLIAAASVAYAWNRPGLNATEMELLRPTPDERLINTTSVDVEFRIDRSDITAATVGFADTAHAYPTQEIFRDRDGVFRTSLAFPDQGEFPLEIRTGDVVWGTFQLQHDSVVSLPADPFRALDPGPFEAGAPILCELRYLAKEESSVTVFDLTGGAARELDLVFTGGRATFTLEAPPPAGAGPAPQPLQLQVRDAAGNPAPLETQVVVYDPALLVQALTDAFPLEPGLASAHPWDLEAAWENYQGWQQQVAASPLSLKALDDGSERSALRTNLALEIERLVRERPQPTVQFQGTSQGSIIFESGVDTLYTNNRQVELSGIVSASRTAALHLDAGRSATLDRDHRFRILLDAPRDQPAEYDFRPPGASQAKRLRVVYEDVAPELWFGDEGPPLRCASGRLPLQVHALDHGAGLLEVRANGVALSPSPAPGGEVSDRWHGELPLPGDGEHGVTLVAKDRAGNTFTEHLVVVRDTQQPTSGIPESLGGEVVGGQTATLRFTFDEPLAAARARYAADAQGSGQLQRERDMQLASSVDIQGSDVTVTIPVPDTQADSLRVVVEATDLAGNSGTGRGAWAMKYNPWGNVPSSIAGAAEILTGPELAERLPPALAADTYVRIDGLRYPRLIRHRSTGLELVFVPPGSFQYGAPGLQGSPSVVMSGFYLARTEVSEDQFARGRVPADLRASDLAGSPAPVLATWREAYLWCDSAGLRLPTEAQWEYAASGPDNRNYPWGALFDAARVSCTPGGGNFDRRFEPSPVDAPEYRTGMSWCGAVQMAGNVYEFCLDVNPPAEVRAGADDPSQPINPTEGQPRIIRGGDFSVRAGREELFTTFQRSPDEALGARRNGFRPVWPLKR